MQAGLAGSFVPAVESPADPPPSRAIVRASELNWPDAAAILHELGASAVSSQPDWPGTYLADFAEPDSASAAVATLSAEPRIEWAELDGLARYSYEPNDPLFADQNWARSIDLPGAWSITSGTEDVIVAVVDSGVSRGHPDLIGKLLQGHDFLNGDNEPEDDIGHGTAVAGIVAAASDDGVGIAGVAPRARILPVKVGSVEGAPISTLAQGIIWAVNQGADVINLSLVADQTSMALQDALLYAYNNGVPVVAAAGNDPNAVTYPGAYPEAISVGASTFWGSVASFSTLQNRVDLIAPGASVLAPWWSPAGDSWQTVTGTSFAAPMVSGTLALLLSIDPDLSVEELRALVTSTALPINGDTPVPGAGAGMLDVSASLRALLERSLEDTWAPADRPVAEELVARSWLWGPAPIATGIERYDQSLHGERLVRYYDKARMEVTDPHGDPSVAWYVTNGLLARELISGEMQVGDSRYQFHGPASVVVAGDPGDPLAPTYSDLTHLLGADPYDAGAPIFSLLDGAGRVRLEERLLDYGVTATHYVPETDHRIASVFWDFLNSQGLIYRDGEYVTGRLFEPTFFATGFPITEAYWTRVLVNGERVDVLLQCFERRCLTYTPSNAPEWRVEMGNVGQHYYRWRYESTGGGPLRGGQFRD